MKLVVTCRLVCIFFFIVFIYLPGAPPGIYHTLKIIISARCLIVSVSSGADPGFFLGGGALVSYSTSTPINHIVFAEYQLY